jgi:glycine cleavage system H protein
VDQSQLKYARTHEWVALEGDVATIGITDFAVHLLSDLVYVDLPKVGRAIQAGQTFGEVESVKAVSDLYAPVSGEVIEVNAGLPDQLEALTADPFGAGWMVKVRLSNPAEVGQLMDHAGYQAHCEAEGR